MFLSIYVSLLNLLFLHCLSCVHRMQNFHSYVVQRVLPCACESADSSPASDVLPFYILASIQAYLTLDLLVSSVCFNTVALNLGFIWVHRPRRWAVVCWHLPEEDENIGFPPHLRLQRPWWERGGAWKTNEMLALGLQEVWMSPLHFFPPICCCCCCCAYIHIT